MSGELFCIRQVIPVLSKAYANNGGHMVIPLYMMML